MLSRIKSVLGLERRRLISTDQVIAAILSRAEGAAELPGATAAVEVAAGMVGRALAGCAVRGRHADRIGPDLLNLVGRSLIRRGESILAISVRDGLPELLPAHTVTVTGAPEPDRWLYSVTLAGPSQTVTRELGSAEVCHFRYGFDPEQPWRGAAPLEFAATTGRLLSNISQALADECGAPRGSFLPLPRADLQDSGLRADIHGARGGLLAVESTASDWQSGGAAPRQDWRAARFGADPPAALERLYGAVFREVVTACGVPLAMIEASSSGAAREAYRQFVALTITPSARSAERELREKLDAPDLELDVAPLAAGDMAGRARSYAALVGAGMSPDKAAEAVGL